MLKNLFLSHNHKDKPFVRKLFRDLENHGVKCWLDEAEMKVGDSLIQKIREGIDNVDFFAVILSPNSINAPWVVNELDVAMNYEISGRKIKVLPLMLSECSLPGFLVGKLYADFREESNYNDSLKLVLNTIGIVFNKNSLKNELYPFNLSTSVNKAVLKNLPLLSAPYHRPFQYIGMTIDRAEKEVGVKSNESGNISLESEECKMLLEAEGNFVSYVDIEIKRTAPHYQNIEFESEPI